MKDSLAKSWGDRGGQRRSDALWWRSTKASFQEAHKDTNCQEIEQSFQEDVLFAGDAGLNKDKADIHMGRQDLGVEGAIGDPKEDMRSSKGTDHYLMVESDAIKVGEVVNVVSGERGRAHEDSKTNSVNVRQRKKYKLTSSMDVEPISGGGVYAIETSSLVKEKRKITESAIEIDVSKRIKVEVPQNEIISVEAVKQPRREQ